MKVVEIKYAVGYACSRHGELPGRLLLKRDANMGTKEYEEAVLFDTVDEAFAFGEMLEENAYPTFVVAVRVVSSLVVRAAL